MTINTRQATVAVIGLGPSTGLRTGYVGLPLRLRFAQYPCGTGQALAVELAKAGPFDVAQGRLPDPRSGPSTLPPSGVAGQALDPAKVDALNAGRSYIADVPTVEVLSAVKAGPYGRASTDYSLS